VHSDCRTGNNPHSPRRAYDGAALSVAGALVAGAAAAPPAHAIRANNCDGSFLVVRDFWNGEAQNYISWNDWPSAMNAWHEADRAQKEYDFSCLR